METAPPVELDDEVVAAGLRDGWSLAVGALTYVPKGAGSYHWHAETDDGPRFVTVDDLDTKPWIARDRRGTFAGLVAAYRTARALESDGLDLVVAPLPADDGSIALRIDDRHSLAVFPMVVGTAGTWGSSIPHTERLALLEALTRLHAPGRATTAGLSRRRRELPERTALLVALDDLEQPWSGGPQAEDARALLAHHATVLRQRFARFDALASALNRVDPPVVVTHGEPHPGNLLATGAGLRLVDWDTVALAEPERDLWMLDTGPGSLDPYVESTGRVLDPAALELWRLAWTLSDLAWLTDAFRRGGERDPDDRWATYVRLLEGGSAAPYGAG
jgi:spectinomycin phosphotransferase